MRNVSSRTLRVICLTTLIFMAAACGGQPQTIPIAQVTTAPSGVEIIAVNEVDSVNSEITQRKSFNQCDSASPFEAQVQFSNSSSQGNQQELVLKASASGEIGISELAKVKIEGAVEQHFASSSSVGQSHQEAVSIKVPAHVQQEYTIVWRETRREGAVQYRENGEAKTTNFSYRVGLELVSATGKDIPCPGQSTTSTTPLQPTAPTVVPLKPAPPAVTPDIPQSQPTRVIIQPTTSPKQTLADGDTAYGDGLSLNATIICMVDCGDGSFSEFTPLVSVKYVLTNISGQRIITPKFGGDEDYIVLDTGERLYDWTSIGWCDRNDYIESRALSPGESIKWEWGYKFKNNQCGGFGTMLPLPDTAKSLTIYFPAIGERFSGAKWQRVIPR